MAKNRLSKERWKAWEERRRLILSADFCLSGTSEHKEARIREARKDYAYFVETYFPHLCTNKETKGIIRCGKFQIDAAKYLKAHRHTRAVFEWARGHAKSTHVSLMIPIWLMIQEERTINVMLLVSKSEDSADRLLSDLQCELEFNTLLRSDFNIRIDEGNWSTGEFKTTDGMLFMALGRGQSPRGIKNRGQRPDYIVIDDIDDDEMVRNQARISQAFDWCLSALLGAMDMGRGRFVLVGNRIGKDSILSRFAERPDTHHTVVNAIDASGQPSWKEKYSREEVLKLRDYMGERRFQKEYMNNPVNEGAVFLRKHIRFGKMSPLKEYRSLICYTDPSFKASTQNDFKATMLVGKTREGVYHVLKAYADQTSVSNMVAWHYDIDGYIDGKCPVMYFMESNFIQDLLLDEFRKVGEAVGHQIPIRGDSRKKPDKFSRIEAMQPLFERGLIVLNEKEKESSGMLQLIEQLLMFEKGSRVHDDAPDALEGAVYLLNMRSMASACTYRVGKRPNRRY
nr:MAG TPA: Large Terminase [Caudoviricetes sp.]